MVGAAGQSCSWIYIIYKTLFLTALILIIIWLYKQIKGPGKTEKESPLDILKSRYAKSEIDQKEYEEKKKDLG